MVMMIRSRERGVKMEDNWASQRILMAGMGSIGQRHLRVLQEMGATEITVTDTNSEVLLKTKEKYPNVETVENYEKGLERDPDAVFILTPPKLHVPMAIQAAEAGCHIFMEKPISDSLENVDLLAETIKRTGRILAVGLCFRYHKGVKELKNLLDTQEFGRIVSIRSMMGEHLPSVRPDYKTLFSAQYSGAFDLMHDLDLALWLAGSPVEDVYSIYGNYSEIGIKAPDLAEIILSFKDCAASVHLDFFQQPRRRQLELMCTKGRLELDFSTWDKCVLTSFYAESGEKNVRSFITERDDMFREEDQAFLQAAKGMPAAIWRMEDALPSLEVIHKIIQKKDDSI